MPRQPPPPPHSRGGALPRTAAMPKVPDLPIGRWRPLGRRHGVAIVALALFVSLGIDYLMLQPARKLAAAKAARAEAAGTRVDCLPPPSNPGAPPAPGCPGAKLQVMMVPIAPPAPAASHP